MELVDGNEVDGGVGFYALTNLSRLHLPELVSAIQAQVRREEGARIASATATAAADVSLVVKRAN